MSIEVNGARRQVDDGTTVADLLTLLGVATPMVAVERNRDIVPRSRHGSTLLRDGDQVEIVTLVGGG